jgi:retinol dehydrogenase 12
VPDQPDGQEPDSQEPDSQDLAGRTYLVTGGNTGIGLATARTLAHRGGRVYLACRSRDKGEAAVAALAAETGNDQIGYLPLDLADLDSVRRCATVFLARDEPLHGLINNAGVAGRRGLTRDGFELCFGVNHLGHFALTTALLDRLAASAPARVVTVASDAHYQATGIDYAAVRRRTAHLAAMPEYSVSKLANVLFSQELARRTASRGITTYALHPGLVASDIWRRVPWPVRPIITRRMLTTEQGAATTLYCAASPDVAGVSGRFYADGREAEPSRVATGELARDLWERSAAWVATSSG